MINLYNLLNIFLLPLYIMIIFIRAFIGKEDIKHLRERFGYGSKRSEQEKIIWLHASSVGESVIVLNILGHINKIIPDIFFLITSGTISSANILKKKLPINAVHQFLPIDNIFFVKKFLKNWRPNLGIFIESELWPCLLSEASKHCKLLLLNARLSDRSFRLWKKVKVFFNLIIGNFSEVIVQSEVDLRKFNSLGSFKAINLGNIKFANQKLEVNESEFEGLNKYFQTKKIILFASTHEEDEKIIFDIIGTLKESNLECYFVLIPRHPERIEDIIKACKASNITYNIKSKNLLPALTDDIYIVDSFGELGLFYKLAYISFIGGSFNHGGHNILEAAHFGNCIIFGPDMSKNADLAKNMINNKAAIQIMNNEELLKKLQYFLGPAGKQEIKKYQKNAVNFIETHQSILENYLAIIKKYIEVNNA